ncbi:TBC1 domain family member 25-like [Haemaphysalis longicornis]
MPRPDGEATTLRLQHLSDLVEHFDHVFLRYLEERGAHDLLFCYRGLLLELKREFAFEDALRKLEVLWGSLAPPAEDELELHERPHRDEDMQSPLPSRVGNPYCKVRAIRRRSSASSVHASPAVRVPIEQTVGSDEDYSQGHEPMTTSMTRELGMELDCLNRRVLHHTDRSKDNTVSETTKQVGNGAGLRRDAAPAYVTVAPPRRRSSDLEESASPTRVVRAASSSNQTSEGYASEEGGVSTPSREASTETIDSGAVSSNPLSQTCKATMVPPQATSRGVGKSRLPVSQDLGGGNPFMMFLLPTLLMQYQGGVKRNNVDYNELAMHFYKMVKADSQAEEESSANSVTGRTSCYVLVGRPVASWPVGSTPVSPEMK